MPKVKLGTKPKTDPREAEIRAVIAGSMAKAGIHSKEAMADKIHVAPSTFRRYIRYPREMRLGMLWDVLDALEVPDETRIELIKGIRK